MTEEKKNKKEPTTFASIWKVLSAIDVSDYIQEKGGLSYLPWAWAWGIMMEYYPDMSVEWHGQGETERVRPLPDVTYYAGETAMVRCTVTIEGHSRDMWLPVMDYKNKAIANPDTRDISDAKMRCLVKCFALFGLGHYIYAGEDLPRLPADAQAAREKVDRVQEWIGRIKESGKRLEASGITVPTDMRKEIVKVFKSKNEKDLKSLYDKLEALAVGPEEA